VNPSENVEITVLMPCLDEAETLATCIGKARGFLERHGIAGEVLVADNGSTDGSQRIAEAHGARVVHAEARGYGNALRAGIEAARGRFVIVGDADDSYDFSALEPFVEALRGGAQLVMGNRFKGGIAPGAMPALHRYLGNPVLSAIGRLFFRSCIGDFHCGLRGFDREAVLSLNLSTGGMEFASEMVVKATLHDLHITEVPTTLRPDGRSRPPHLRSWHDGWRHLKFLLMLSPRWLFLYPGLGLMALGTLMTAWIIGDSRHLLGVVLDVNTLVYGAATLIAGVQLAAFGVFAEIISAQYGVRPERERSYASLRRLPLEYGILAGVALALAGFACSIYAIAYWGDRGFGGLVPAESLRIVVPGATLMVVGTQITFSSFFLALISRDDG
jgi:glycosyltransferase involved in cell wall biosynthesis